MDNLIDWVEQSALSNLRGHSENADGLALQSNSTLTLLLTAAGASLGYSITKFDTGHISHAAIMAACLALYFFILAAILIIKCIKVKDFPSITNEPKNLFQEKYSLDSLRKQELKNIQVRIDQAVRRNYVTAFWLNRIRLAASLTPILVFIIILVVAAHLF